ncbi:MAG: hypothetical protein GOMPHAMPRED_005508 [Gomphillus americanus]|uniref:CipC protein n=1 Tax=Gomphillus americanus TaxID=1940652 RepID=A0A8H3IVI8_9LECA|nr:MAG: hypothetical protein GOMPHAMPRED_005508 [Gomphillus americanus]
MDSDQAQAYNYVQNTDQFGQEHQAKLSHELIGGAAAFEAMKAYEDHVERNGQPENHKFAKELAAGFAGAFVDRIAETKGEDFYDRERAKHHAKREVEQGM